MRMAAAAAMRSGYQLRPGFQTFNVHCNECFEKIPVFWAEKKCTWMDTTTKELRAWAPGRINLIGEHTDYNDGFVMPAAIDRGINFRLSRNGTSDLVNARALDFNESWSFSLNQMSSLERGSWQNYIMGVAAELINAGAGLSGFDLEFGGNIPIGGGLSSSAALCVGTGLALNELFSLNFEKWALIKMAQLAEHHYAGTHCGIMDQFASMMGSENRAMLLDCRSLEFEYFPIFTTNFDLLLLNSGVSHALADSEYNQRRSECEEGLLILQRIYPELISLRDVSNQQLEDAKAFLPPKIFCRCRHVASENLRVQAAANSMQKNDYQTVGSLLYQSHDSLRFDYEVSCPELDFLVDFTRRLDAVMGCRMMGGGFGGCTIQLVKRGSTPEFVESISPLYHERFGIYPEPIQVSIGEGASVIGS